MSSRSRRAPLAAVCVIDTSALIQLKRLVPPEEQWSLLTKMGSLVERGLIAFPREVVAEVKNVQFPDGPGIWAMATRGWAVHSHPRDEYVAEALGAAQLTDPNADPGVEPADPYVVGLALQVLDQDPSCDVAVVTEDIVDRMPSKESILTACVRLEVECCRTEVFLEWLREQTS